MTASPALIDFADPLPTPAEDRPAAGRCLGPPPLRTTWSRYAAGAVDCGLWAAEPGTWRIAFHHQRHEFFQVLEGRIRITDTAGQAREFGPGDACVIPAGFQGLFQVLEATKKHYVMIDGPVAGTHPTDHHQYNTGPQGPGP